MHSGERGRWRLGHRPGLDGLRGLAIGLVLLSHGAVPGFTIGGKVGVTLFFVLSGFLITALLLEEHDDTGRISLRAFYLRRVRRLAPAFALCVAATCLLGAVAASSGFLQLRDVLYSVSYIGNWYPALMHTPKPAPLGGLTGTWSLSVEEQFYLLWPALLILAVRRGGAGMVAKLAIGGIAASLVIRFALVAEGASAFRIYYGTDTNAAALLAGALLAVTLHRRAIPALPTWVLPVTVAGLLAMSSLNGAWAWIMLPVAACALAAVVTAATTEARWLTPRWLVWLGRRSYAVYLWNCLIAVAVFWVPMAWPVRTLVVVVPSLLLAELSWRCVESPFLKARGRVVLAERLDGRSVPVAG